jgi:type I restriction enzyme M protein
LAAEKNASLDVAEALRGVVYSESVYPLTCIAYILSTMGLGEVDDRRLEDACQSAVLDLARQDPVIEDYLSKHLKNTTAEQRRSLLDLAGRFGREALEEAVAAGPADQNIYAVEGGTPDGVVKLALAVLGIKPGDKVLDLCSGCGDFLTAAKREFPDAYYEGVEIDRDNCAIAKIRSRVAVPGGIKYEIGDVLGSYGKPFYGDKANKAFSNFPWGMRTSMLARNAPWINEFDKVKAGYNRPVSADWVFCRVLLDSIEGDGVAVGIMANGAMFNSTDAKVRKYFVENGWIKAVVALPDGLFSPYTGIGTSLVVMGHGGGGSVRVVDATDLGEKQRRTVTLGDAAVEEILRRLGHDSERSAAITVDELAESAYDLHAPRYLEKDLDVPCPIKFSKIIKSMTRGASVKAAELDELTCREDTGINYLMLGNIEDGLIAPDLPNLRGLDPKLEKYCVHNGDLLISKISPIKVAVAEIPEGRKVLANGNVHVVSLVDGADPYYIAAFLSSSVGKRELSLVAKGTAMKTVNAADVKALVVPDEDEERKEKVSAIYRAKLDEIQVYKLGLERARAEVADLFSEGA